MNDVEDRDTPKSSSSETPNRRTGQDPPMIVIAEDDKEMSSLLARAFTRAGYEVNTCQNGWDLLKILGVFPAIDTYKDVALVVADIRMPGITGLEALKICGYVGTFPPVILITAFGDSWTREEAMKLGAVEMLDKPFDIDDLVERVRKLVPPPS
jgi:DNA-binding response OmpR family regulator